MADPDSARIGRRSVHAAPTGDSEFAEEWARLAVARLVAVELIRYRSQHGLSQRALAAELAVSQPRIVELESGEKSPTLDTLVKIAAAIGVEFVIDIVPVGMTPRLVGKGIRDGRAQSYGGASVLVAAGGSAPRVSVTGRIG